MRLRRLIPRKDYPTWKLIAEICLIIIVLITPIEIAHLVFHVEVEERLLSFLEVIDYLAIIVLLIDLVHHYLITKRKDRFLKENLLHILSFLPYILFIKV
ncbi:hypothetical protein KJ660_03280, partial [Candidatus Micrarchaeota archaeon]|nr:hypothetical protein [Candidatus Micrarchaeota archaeon]